MTATRQKRVLITRTRHQASELAERLSGLGFEVVIVPTIEIVPPHSWCALDAALACLRSYAAVLFTSANAVEFFARRLADLRLAPHPRSIAVVGPATAKAVRASGLAADDATVLLPPKFVAESLAATLIAQAPQPGRRYLLVQAEQARDVLPELLRAAGAHVTVAAAYANRTPEGTIAALKTLFAEPDRAPHAITFTSSSTARNLLALMHEAKLAIPAATVLASIGPITSATLRDLGYPPTVEANQATVESLAQAVTAALNAS